VRFAASKGRVLWNGYMPFVALRWDTINTKYLQAVLHGDRLF